MDGFDQLTKVKRMREEIAERALLAQRRKLEAAKQEREQKHRQLEEFRRAATEEENRMYGDLCSRLVHLHDIQFVNDQMQVLREKRHQHQNEVKAADTRCETEKRQLEVNRATHSQARRVHEKFTDLSAVLAQEKRVEQG